MSKLIKLNLILFFVFMLVACMPKEIKNPEAIKIGVVETSGTHYKSVIHWYDQDLEVIDQHTLSYASLGNTFVKPTYYEEEIFLIPEGIFTKKDTEKVISIDKNDFEIKEYSVPNIALQDVAVTDDYIFTISNLNYVTHLSRVDKKSQEFTEITYDGALMTSIIANDNKLFIFGNMNRQIENEFIYVMDVDFNMLETIDLKDVGRGAYKFLVDEQTLYASISRAIDDRAIASILKLNLDSYAFEIIELDILEPDSLVKYKDTLIIAHNDITTGKGSKVSVLNLKTFEKDTFDLGSDLAYMDVYKNYLVTSDAENLSLFDIEKDFKLLKEISVDKKADTYLSSIIIID